MSDFKIDKKVLDLICELEYIIGDRCYNPNSYNGWTGDEGCNFRYPVYFNDGNDAERRTRGYVHNISVDSLNSLKYKFGSNHLYIGKAIIDVLSELEERYDISFVELENKYHEKMLNRYLKEMQIIYEQISEKKECLDDYFDQVQDVLAFTENELDIANIDSNKELKMELNSFNKYLNLCIKFMNEEVSDEVINLSFSLAIDTLKNICTIYRK